MNNQMVQLAQLLAQGGATGAAGQPDAEPSYQDLLGGYQQAQQRQDSASGLGRMGGGLLAAGAAVHPALGLLGGLMAWRARSAMKDAKAEGSEVFEKLKVHEDFKVMDLLGSKPKRGLGERFKENLGTMFGRGE